MLLQEVVNRSAVALDPAVRSRLTVQFGSLPAGLGLEPASVSGVLAGDVFHFLNGPALRASLQAIFEALQPGGVLAATICLGTVLRSGALAVTAL